MQIRPASLSGVFTVEPSPRGDARGFLARTYCDREFAGLGLNTQWVQQNHTRTHGAGSVRGMHIQAEPHPEIKLVRCLAGEAWDVVVDVRAGSPTFGQWEAFHLTAENMRAVYIPAGFAHGFQCLSNSCDLFYLMSDFYQEDLARGVRWDDTDVGISWPMPVINLSPRDQGLPLLGEMKLD